MGTVTTALAFLNIVLVLALAAGFVIIVVSLWRMSRDLRAIAATLRVLAAERLARRGEESR